MKLNLQLPDYSDLSKARATYDRTAAELERHRQLLTDAQREQAELLATGKFDDADTINQLSQLKGRIDLLPSRIAAFEKSCVEQDEAAKTLAANKLSDHAAVATKIMEAIKSDLDAALTPYFPNAGERGAMADLVAERSAFVSQIFHTGYLMLTGSGMECISQVIAAGKILGELLARYNAAFKS